MTVEHFLLEFKWVATLLTCLASLVSVQFMFVTVAWTHHCTATLAQMSGDAAKVERYRRKARRARICATPILLFKPKDLKKLKSEELELEVVA